MDDSYSLALLVQDASNLSGVGHDFGKLCTMVREEYAAEYDGATMPTLALAQHPAVYLYVSKMAEMVGISLDSEEMDRWIDAYNICKERAKVKWGVVSHRKH